MEDEQNLKKNTCKGTHAKRPKNAGKLQTGQKMYEKNTTFTSIWLGLLKCPAVTSANTSQYQ